MLSQPVRAGRRRLATGVAGVRAAAAARGGRGGIPMTTRLPDAYFDRMYAGADDPWQLSARWYEQRKYAITLALLPEPPLPARVRAGLFDRDADRAAGTALRPRDRGGCGRCGGAKRGCAAARGRLPGPGDAGPSVAGRGVAARPVRPAGAQRGRLLPERRHAGRRCCAGNALGCSRARKSSPHTGATPWPTIRSPATRPTPSSRRTPGLTSLGCYRDRDVVVEVFDTGDGRSVAAREEVPGARG